MRSVFAPMFRVPAGLLAVFVLLVVSGSAALAHNPPPGIGWKEDIASGKADAAARKVPIVMYVADDTAANNEMSKSFQDPRVQRMLRNFACVFVSRSYKVQKLRASYVPWIGETASTMYKSPLLVFGDARGNPRREFRAEGKALSADELLKRLEKALKALAPDKAKGAIQKALKSMTVAEYMKRLDGSIGFLEKNLSPEMRAQFTGEADSALATCKFLKKKLNKIKNKEKKKDANKHYKTMEKNLKKLARYKGKKKDAEKYLDYVEKARKALDELKTALDRPEPETITLTCKAVPETAEAAAPGRLKTAVEKIDHVTKVTIKETGETVKVKETELKILALAVTCEKDEVEKADIEKVLEKAGYKAAWTKAKE